MKALPVLVSLLIASSALCNSSRGEDNSAVTLPAPGTVERARTQLDLFRTSGDFQDLWKALHAARAFPESPDRPASKSLRLENLALLADIIVEAHAAIERSFNPTDKPSVNVAPPVVGGSLVARQTSADGTLVVERYVGAKFYDSGISPAEIKEPELRRRYEESISENTQKALKYRKQVQLRQIYRDALNSTRAYIARTFSRPDSDVKVAHDAVFTLIKDKSVVDYLFRPQTAK